MKVTFIISIAVVAGICCFAVNSPVVTLFLICHFAAVLSFAVFMIKRNGVYAYDATKSYNYDFEETEAVIDRAEWMDGHVRLPAVGEGRQSAFLKVDVKASLLGSLVDPRVEIQAGGRTEVQYFERGAKGTRYINVSSFMGPAAVELVLEAHHVEFDAQSAELIRFENRIPENPSVLVIAPHPDDAEIAAYGFYSDVKEAYIITITAGDAGIHNYDKVYPDLAEHSLMKGKLRTWNSITVPMLCGIPPERSINLGFCEGRLKEMFNDRELEAAGIYSGIAAINMYRKQNLSSLADALDGGANWDSLVANLTRLVERIKPDIVVTPHPVLDVHEDHRYSTMAVCEAIKKVGLRSGQCFFYVNHIRFNHLYPYGPMGSVIPLPPSFGKSPYFSSIHSHPLSPEKQRNKMFSLEAMNDLRPNTDRKFSSGATLAALKAPLKSALGYDDSYYRRAVRRNELFFVVGIEELYDAAKEKRLTEV